MTLERPNNLETSPKISPKKTNSNDVEKLVKNAQRLRLINDYVESLGKNTDSKTVYKKLDTRLKTAEELKNFDEFIKSYPDEDKEKIIKDILGFLDFGYNINQSITYVRTGKDITKLSLDDTKRCCDENINVYNLLDIITDLIVKGENPFISRGNNPCYAIKIPSEFNNLHWSIPTVNETGYFIIDDNNGLNESELNALMKHAMIVLEGYLKNLVQKSENPGELIKDKNFFDLFNLYLHLHDKSFPSQDDERKDIEDAFSIFLNTKLYLKVESINDDMLARWNEREEEIRRENMRIMEEARKKALEQNRNLHPFDVPNNIDLPQTIEENNNYNTAKGEEIAKKLRLVKYLGNYSVNTDSYEINDGDLEDIAFNNAWKDFIEKNSNIAGLITKDDIIQNNIFDKENKLIDKDNLEGFCSGKGIVGDEIGRMYDTLSVEFCEMYRNTLDTLKQSPSSKEAGAKIDEYIKTSAIGSVIDNVRDIFSDISKNFEEDLGDKGFKFNDNEPVKIQGDNLVMTGTFNGADVIVRYDLSSGEVFMNSFLQCSDNSTMIIGNNLVANYKVGDLEKFNDLLSNRGLLSTQLNLLSDVVVEKSKKESAINSIVVNFLRTFNIVKDGVEIKNIEINNGSNLFDLFQIIYNSDSETLNKFLTLMEKIFNADCSGLKWGENNLLGSEKVFEENYENDYMNLIKDSAEDFNKKSVEDFNNTDAFKENINSNLNLKFASYLIDKTKNNEDKPNWKLDPAKIDEILNNLPK